MVLNTAGSVLANNGTLMGNTTAESGSALYTLETRAKRARGVGEPPLREHGAYSSARAPPLGEFSERSRPSRERVLWMDWR